MRHEPVLVNEVLSALKVSKSMKVIDCTLGDAGHAQAILDVIGKNGCLLGIDADAEGLLRAKRYLYKYEDNFIAVRDNFINLSDIIKKNNFPKADAVLFDLGWSLQQFTERSRGFSFQNLDEDLDMRYSVDQSNKGLNDITAERVINEYSIQQLSDVFRRYGEEKLHRHIAKAIVVQRKIKPIKKVRQLVQIISEQYKKHGGFFGRLNPATKVFQALRIEVNYELEALKQALPQAVSALKPSGRLAVITFHSLEDRIVKRFFKEQNEKTIFLPNKKPIVPTSEEIAKNPRSRSAKLRVAEKI
ncbi:MAG: 16S rRNA (cytosine(1402)-N(4))-methyltransferase RsmH [bacterium]